jgi:DNA processing protein
MVSLRTIERGEREYPCSLERVPHPPARLHLRGSLGSCRRTVAVVGAREPDDYGLDLAREMVTGLARARVSVVSGGARGIDAAAHRAALEAGGHTVAVMGCGMDIDYPGGHRELFERIVETGGALVSEYEDGTEPARYRFHERNRIIAGLSDAVLVVRAGQGSGALITAAWARRAGVPVFAVPGDARADLSAGPHALLRAGARLATSAADLLDALGLALPEPAPAEAPRLEGDAAALWTAMSRQPRHADELARAAGIPPGAALAALLCLELSGLCEQRPGHLFLRRA